MAEKKEAAPPKERKKPTNIMTDRPVMMVSPVRSQSPPSAAHVVASAHTYPLPRTVRGENQAFIIGITGGSASGKTSFAQQILKMLPNQRVVILSQDNFYRGLKPEEQATAADFNFDHPDAFDWETMYNVLAALRERKRVEVPTYDYVTHTRSKEVIPLWNYDVVLFEGILTFHPHPNFCLLPLMDLKIFVETDSDTRLARRVLRDTKERGRSVESVLQQYERFVKPAYDQYIAPLKRKADVIIPWGDYSGNVFNDDGNWKLAHYPALDMIVEHIQTKLAACSPVGMPPRSVSPANKTIQEI